MLDFDLFKALKAQLNFYWDFVIINQQRVVHNCEVDNLAMCGVVGVLRSTRKDVGTPLDTRIFNMLDCL